MRTALREKTGAWQSRNIAARLSGLLRAGLRRQSVAGGWAAPLEGVVRDLEGLNRRTEQDFLQVGGRLAEFLSITRQVSADMAALSALFAGEGGQSASQLLSRILVRCRETEARAGAGDRALAAACEASGRIARSFRAFGETVSMFRVVASLTRIETARLGNTGAEFGNLAEEVRSLTESIQSGGRGILETSSILQERIQSAVSRVSNLRASALQELPALISAALAALRSLEERHGRAQEASLRQAAECTEISAAIEDLTTTIQFHDVTRQRVEHVAAALRRMCAEPQDGVKGGNAAPLDARTALIIQSSQLAEAEQIFAAAVDRIERDLESIARRVQGLAQASRTLLGFAEGDHGSFFLQMESRFTAILKILASCDQAENETDAVLGGLEQTVARMRAAVADVREIEIQIRRLAINAAIRAAQIGETGSALHVIAEVMQRLALASAGVTGEAAGDLAAMGDAAGWLSGGSQEDAESVLSEVRATVLELHSSSEMSFSRLNQIAALSQRLCDDIHAVRAGFSAGAAFAECVGRARAALAQVGEHARAIPDEPDAMPSAKQPFEDLAKHYTMQSERDVHESVLAGAAISRPAETPAPATVSGDPDLGDNVELF